MAEDTVRAQERGMDIDVVPEIGFLHLKGGKEKFRKLQEALDARNIPWHQKYENIDSTNYLCIDVMNRFIMVEFMERGHNRFDWGVRLFNTPPEEVRVNYDELVQNYAKTIENEYTPYKYVNSQDTTELITELVSLRKRLQTLDV